MSPTACKKCGQETRVTHVYRREGEIVRRRICPACKIVFHTSQPDIAEKVIGGKPIISPQASQIECQS